MFCLIYNVMSDFDVNMCVCGPSDISQTWPVEVYVIIGLGLFTLRSECETINFEPVITWLGLARCGLEVGRESVEREMQRKQD